MHDTAMALRLGELVPLRTLPKTLDAACYNRVRLALLRLDNPLRVELPRLRVEMRLDDTAWLCYRPYESHLPLLAWTAFETRNRALHEPVPCKLHLYHFHAGLLMSVVLSDLNTVLDEHLSGARGHAP